MKEHLNLLPPRIQEKKKRRLLLIRLATIQVAIFFVAAALILVVVLWERSVWERSVELTQRLEIFLPEAAEAAARVQMERVAANYLDALLAEIIAVPFNAEWLPYILHTVPSGASLAGLDYRDGLLMLTGVVSDIAAVETHRANMAEIFNYVSLGRVFMISGGQYTYELVAWAGE